MSLTWRRYSALHWRAWALLDLLHTPKMFEFRDPTAEEIDSFRQWDAQRILQRASAEQATREQVVSRKLDEYHSLQAGAYPMKLRTTSSDGERFNRAG